MFTLGAPVYDMNAFKCEPSADRFPAENLWRQLKTTIFPPDL